ncbi:autotransporter assembly complex protein TamA [Sphingomonas aracearum]|nr:BamA/TamA family outer membrane protein [Sphingomonas aracearum]
MALAAASLLAPQQAPTNRDRQQAPAPTPAPGAAPADDTPIVPDEAFNQALPSLSGDINAPLEAMPQLPPAATPALPGAVPLQSGQAAADTGDTLTPPAANDPELAQPLSPLGTFNATPPVEVAETRDKETVEIRYETELRGLEEIGLQAQFQSLSALREGKGKAANTSQINARAKEDEALAVRLMQSRGYYDGTALSTIEAGREGQPAKAIVSATPGKLYTFGSVTVQADATVPPNLVRDQLPLKVDDPIEADRVQGAEANVALKLPQQGYPFVKVGQRDILLDEQTFKGDYTLPVETGPRSSFGGVTTEGDLAFDAEHVAVLQRFKAGELYDVRKVDDLREAMVATGLFANVGVEPVRTGRPGPDGTEAVDLKVIQDAGPARSLSAQAGYQTGQGFTLEGTFTHRNLFPPEGALIPSIVAGTQEQGAGLTFRRSNAGKRDRTFSIIASANHSNYDAFDAFTGTLAAKISYDSTPIWQKRFTYAYGVELTGTNESVYDFNRLERRRGTYGIVALPGQAMWDTSNDLLNPTKGYRLKVNLSPETSVRGAVRPYVRAMVEGTVYVPAGKSFVIAGRARAGTIQGIERDDLAPSRRYYGGGGGSVRGYGYQRLGPFDPNGDPVGGRSINEFSLEARYRFGNFGIVPFIDAGNAYESSLPKGSDLRMGAGIGGRFYTNFGPMRIDVATPLNPREGDGKIALYISIGQAF